jgi:regulation of enolase protein 1 (concanavalin A-like superfamily)
MTGVMMRETLDAGSKNVALCLSPSNLAWFNARSTTDDWGSCRYSFACSNYWLKLDRTRSNFSAYKTEDGGTWTLVNTIGINMASTINVGLCGAAYQAGYGMQASTFDHVSVTPSTWGYTDIGTVGVAGEANPNPTLKVVGSGYDIWGTSDQCRFVYKQASGDCSITARVASQQNTHPWAKAGVMIRESLNADAAFAMTVMTPGNGVNYQCRTSTGGNAIWPAQRFGVAAPYWVRVTRVGDLFTSYCSPDGSNWTLMNSTTIVMGTNVYIGMPVSCVDLSITATDTFDNVEAETGLTGAVAAWTSVDINAPIAGSTSSDSTACSIVASGYDIWGTADWFGYFYKPVTGDCSITARVVSQQNTNSCAKAGVMIRETLDIGAPFAMNVLIPGYGADFMDRTSSGGEINWLTGAEGVAPYWVRMTRVGNVFTAYRSPDGTTWTNMGSQTITMGASVYVGLPVTSHDNNDAGAVTFDNVTTTP